MMIEDVALSFKSASYSVLAVTGGTTGLNLRRLLDAFRVLFFTLFLSPMKQAMLSWVRLNLKRGGGSVREG